MRKNRVRQMQCAAKRSRDHLGRGFVPRWRIYAAPQGAAAHTGHYIDTAGFVNKASVKGVEGHAALSCSTAHGNPRL